MNVTDKAIILGAGPAGLTAALTLNEHRVCNHILEKDEVVGGLARTGEYKQYRFDLGGHRFFTKVPIVQAIWEQVLGDDLLTRSRLSRIYYRSKFFAYPIEPLNALRGLGVTEATRCMFSYVSSRMCPRQPERDFETWITNRFGRRLFEIFFQTYTEKVWGIPCRQIGAEWAAQRIRGLSLMSLLADSLQRWKKRSKQRAIKTLIKEFQYPRLGPGMLWSRLSDIITAQGSKITLRAPVTKISWKRGQVVAVRAGQETYTGSHFLSSLPLRDLILSLDPAPSRHVLSAANDFHYRDFLMVLLIVSDTALFRDNWIYIHDPAVKVGRIQNYNNWSPDLNPVPGTTCLGLEYFCSHDDQLWSFSADQLIALARTELAQIGLADPDKVIDGTVVRLPKAYPIYDDTYKNGIAVIREFLNILPNLQTMGRNGMHRYNNQDHSMLTGILAAHNVLGSKYNLWEINADAEYHEQDLVVSASQVSALESSQPLVPARLLTLE